MKGKKSSNKKKPGKALERKILSLFTSEPSLKMMVKDLIGKMGKNRYAKDDIAKAANQLWKKGILDKENATFFLDKSNPTHRGKSNNNNNNNRQKTIEGIVDMTASGAAYIVSDSIEKDVYVPQGRTGRAFNGDRVKVRIFKSRGRGRKLEGEIVEIVERRQSQFTGLIKISKSFSFLIPDRQDLNVDIFIPQDKINGAQSGDKVLVQIVEWPKNKKSPVAEVVTILGKPGEHNVEMQSILVENGFPLTFPTAVLQAADDIPITISEAALDGRLDFRSVPTFTIDPKDAKDFDDALSIRKLDSGNWEVGIHIADVSAYVPEGSILDKEAYKRSTSVYLVDRVLPMFPERISNLICSLRPKEDKLCYSAIFELTENGNVLTRWFGRTVINSDRRFNYKEAQGIIDSGEGDMAGELRILNDIAKKLRLKRMQAGSINFGSEEVRFILDDTGKPVDLYVKEILDTNLLVEDFMLLANRTVARYINTCRVNGQAVPSVNRVHASPDMEKLDDFKRFAANFGYKVQFDQPETVAENMNKLLAEVKGKPEEQVLSTLAIRSMSKAAYSTQNEGHFGLAFKNYVHFTSPIRRYPDVMTHRILQKILHHPSAISFNAEALEKKCVHSSAMERKALSAERQSIKYKQVEFLQDKIGEVFEGVISGVTKFGFFVELKENKCEGLVRLDSLYDDIYFFDDARLQIAGRNAGKIYRMGESVKVKVINTDLTKRVIDFEVA